jgi:hypothetical protein
VLYTFVALFVIYIYIYIYIQTIDDQSFQKLVNVWFISRHYQERRIAYMAFNSRAIGELCTGRERSWPTNGCFRNFLQATEENHENLQSEWPVSRPGFETGTSRMYVRSVTTGPAWSVSLTEGRAFPVLNQAPRYEEVLGRGGIAQ